MSKIKSRMDYARELQDEIKGVVMYAYERIQSLIPVEKRLHEMGDEVWFEDSFEGNRDKIKFKEKEKKVTKLYKELDSYTKQTKYNEIYRAFLVELKDEDDEAAWNKIFTKYRQKVLDLKIFMNSTYHEFLSKMTEIFKTVTEQKRKEREFKMKDTPIEEFVRNEERIRTVLYEKCNAGEITLEQREAALSKLGAYTEAAKNFTSEVHKAVEEYCEGVLTCEELDNVVSGYFKENPQQAMYYEGTHIDNRFNAMKNEVVGLYNAGALTLEDAKDCVDYLDNMYMIQTYEHARFLENGDVPTTEHAFSEAMDNYFGSIREFKESVDDGNEIDARSEAMSNFLNETWNYLESTLPTEMTEGVLTASVMSVVVTSAYIAAAVAILSIPIGKVINMKKGNTVIKAYEELHPDAVKFKSLRISKLTIENTGAKYIPEIKGLLDKSLEVNGKCYLAKHGSQPFAVVASIYHSVKTTVSTSSGGYASASETSKVRYYFKALCPEAVKHKEFYEAALMLKKFKKSTPEIKEFCKDLKADLEDYRKEQEKTEEEKKEAEKKAKTEAEARIAKESTGIEYDNDKVYQYVREQLMDKFVAGEITLEQREAALIEARDRLFGDDLALIEEGFFDNAIKKITGGNCGGVNPNAKTAGVNKAKAQYTANNAEIKRLQSKIQQLEQMQSQNNLDPATFNKCAAEVKKLQEKVKVLVNNNGRLSKQMMSGMQAATESVEEPNVKIYRAVCEQVTDKFVSGEITFEEREAMLESARERVLVDNYDVIEEGVIDNAIQKISDKVQKSKVSGSIEQMRAKYLANMAEVKRLEKKIKDLETVNSRRDIDPATARRCSDQIKKLQAKAKKLEAEAQKVYAKMSAKDVKEAPTRKFNEKLAKTAAVTQ